MTENKKTKKTMPAELRKALAAAGFKQAGGGGGGGGMERTPETVKGVAVIEEAVGNKIPDVLYVVLPSLPKNANLPGTVVKVSANRTTETKTASGKVKTNYPALKNVVNAYAKDHNLEVFSLPGSAGKGYILTK